MASKFYRGTAAAVQMVDRFTPANVEIGDIFTLTATGEDGSTAAVTFTATAATVANVTAGLVAAWNASTNALHTGVTAADATTSLTLTADTAGVPFSVASSTTDGGGANTQTLTRAAVTANSGPSDWNIAANWSDNAVPVTGDNVTLDGRMAAAVLYGLNQAGVTLASLRHYVGAKAVGTVSAALRIGATLGDSNLPTEDGSRPSATFFNVNVGTVQTTWNNWDSAGQGSSGLEPVLFDGTHASNVLNVFGGIVGVGTMTPGDTTVVVTLNVIGKGKSVVSNGTTLTTVNLEESGRAVLRCDATTVNVRDQNCDLKLEQASAVTTINCNGKATINSTGTIANLHIEDTGNVNTRETNNARTITNAFIYGGGTLTTDLNTSYPNGVDVLRGARSAQADFGDNVTLTPSAV